MPYAFKIVPTMLEKENLIPESIYSATNQATEWKRGTRAGGGGGLQITSTSMLREMSDYMNLAVY